MKPLPHQIEFSAKCWDIVKTKGYVYLAGKPRAGKTLTALLIAEKSDKATRWLIITKKNAIPGWTKFIEDEELELKHSYYVTNYEQLGSVVNKTVGGKVVKKTIKLKIDPKDYDGLIVDESHNTGGVGKPSGRHLVIRSFCKDLPHIHLSGTAIVETPCSIYYQMKISKYTPFNHLDFYKFHKEYGIPYHIEIGGREINQYDKAKPELLGKIDEFTVYMTQEDAGIDASLQAVDVEHYIDLSDDTKARYNTLMKDSLLHLENTILVCDTTMKLRTSLHMLESGVLKIDDEYIPLGNTEKIDYIKEKFGDEEDIGIMCHFVGERKLLEKIFTKANIYSSSAHAEGVDLSHLRYFIILSSDYSGSKFIQRRDRIINTSGSKSLEVHHILVKNAISEQVYKKVSKKQDFNNKTYEARSL